MSVRTDRPAFWMLYAYVYDVLRRLRPYTTMQVELMTAAELEGTECVIDLGCGTGNLAELLLETHPNIRVVGVDSSPQMLRRAKKKCGSRLQDVKVNLVEALPDELAACDVIVSCNVLYALPDPEGHLLHLAKTVRPGTRLVLTTPATEAAPVKIFRAHLRQATLRDWAWLPFILPKLLLVGVFNRLIMQRVAAGSYQFVSEQKLCTWLTETGWDVLSSTVTYAGFNTLVTATRGDSS